MVLPSDRRFKVADTGRTFWFAGPVNDPRSDFGQAFVELQFSPDALVTKCTGGRGSQVVHAPGSHAGIVVLRVPDQSAATVTTTISGLAGLTELASLAGSVAVLQRGLLRIRRP